MIRLVIADDHSLVREGLKQILSGASDIMVIGEHVHKSCSTKTNKQLKGFSPQSREALLRVLSRARLAL